MKLREKYSYLKKVYSDYIVLIKSGSVYITYDNDAIILNNIFDYQNINNKVGFPIRSVDKIMNSLNDKNINYIIDNNDDSDILELNKILLDKIKFLIESNEENYEKIRRFIDEL